MTNYIKVATKSEIKTGTGRVVNAGGTSVALFNVDGAFYAVHNTCLHRQGPLGEGELSGSVAPLMGRRGRRRNHVGTQGDHVNPKDFKEPAHGNAGSSRTESKNGASKNLIEVVQNTIAVIKTKESRA